MAASIVDILLRAKNLASKELNQVTSQLQGLDKAAKFAAGGLSVLAGGFAIQQAVKFAAEMAQLNTQVERSAYAFEHFSGGAAQAAANMRAVQRASGGTLTTLEAQNVAVVGLTQKLASNSQELERMTRIARGIVSISPMINDVETAFSQLGLTIANQSMMRLDQLGTSAVEVRAKMNELKAETKGLTDEQAFQDALISILEGKFNSLTDAAVNQASGLEVLRKAWVEYRITAAESFGWFDDLARRVGQELNVETQLRGAQRLIESLPPVISPEQLAIVQNIQNILDNPLRAGDSWIEIGAQLDTLIDKYYEVADARMNFFKGVSVGPQIDFPVDDSMFTTEQDQKRLQTLEDFNKEIEKLIATQAKAAQISVFDRTGSVELAAEEYSFATEQLNNWVAAQIDLIDLPFEEKIATIANLLPTASSNLLDTSDDAKTLRESLWGLIETLARAEQSDFVFGGGDALQSIEVYNDALTKLRSLVGSGDFNLGSLEDLETLLNVLPGMFQNVGIAAGDTAGEFDILANSIDRVYRVASTMGEAFQDATQGVAKTVSDFLGELIDISEVTETQARAAQNQALAQTGDYDFAQSEYERVKQAAKELIATNVELGRSVTDLVPIFGTLLDNAIDTDYTDSIAELRKQVFELIETLARAEQRDFVLGGGDALQSIEVYNDALAKLRSLVGSGDFNLGGLEDLKTLLNVLPGMLRNAGVAAENAAGGFDILATAMRGVVSIMGKIDGAMQGTASTVAGFLANLADMTGDMQMELFSIGADFGQGLEGGRDFTAQMLPEVQQMVVEWGLAGATLEEITQVLLPNYLSDLESANAELYATGKSVKTIDSGFESLKNTVAGIVSGAIGPVAGVDADDLLPRPDAVNENARRLADIAVNGFKGQDWLDEFALEVPDVFEELKNSSDPKSTAAQILKDFQDGLRPDLIDKDRAKELVKRALQGDANTKALVDEIAGELASELGISLSEAKAKAGEVLSGDTGSALDVSFAPTIDKTAAVEAAGSFSAEFMSAIESGVLDVSFTPTIDNTAAIEAVSSFAAAFTSAIESGAFDMSLAPTIDNTAASGAASSFAAAFTSAIEGSTLGADMSGAIFTQVTASVALIEESGKEAGRALVRGVTATFTDIPAAFIAAVASLVTPSVVAAMANNGGRTGAAAS